MLTSNTFSCCKISFQHQLQMAWYMLRMHLSHLYLLSLIPRICIYTHTSVPGRLPFDRGQLPRMAVRPVERYMQQDAAQVQTVPCGLIIAARDLFPRILLTL